MSIETRDNWASGSNNIAKPERLPENSVVKAVNMDPTNGGKFELRTGFVKVNDCAAGRAVFPLGTAILFVDGGDLKVFDARTNQGHVVGSVNPNGEVAGCEHNNQLYLSTPTESLRFDGNTVRKWGVPSPVYTINLVDGHLPTGTYKVAVTAYGEQGEESGADAVAVSVPEGKAIQISCNDPRSCTVYCSSVNGSTLYAQGLVSLNTFIITSTVDNTQRFTTDEMTPMPPCSLLVSHHAVIVGAYNNIIVMTEPMWPHLTNPITRFIQLPRDITMLASVDTGVFVATDEETYWLTDVETDEPSSVRKTNFGAVRGTAVKLPDGRAAWFTRYGQAIGDASGNIELPNRVNYAPDIATDGAAGVLEHNGNQLVVTTLKGQTTTNSLGAGDFWQLEVIDNDQ